MPYSQLADHLANNIIQVQTCFHVRKKGGVFLLDRLPILAMHILQIETIPESTPSLIEDLRPFLRIVYRDLHIRQINRLA